MVCFGLRLPEKAAPHLFEVFYRGDPARQNPQKGSGLGLSIAERSFGMIRRIVLTVGESGGLTDSFFYGFILSKVP